MADHVQMIAGEHNAKYSTANHDNTPDGATSPARFKCRHVKPTTVDQASRHKNKAQLGVHALPKAAAGAVNRIQAKLV
jgi:hypothetical protein